MRTLTLTTLSAAAVLAAAATLATAAGSAASAAPTSLTAVHTVRFVDRVDAAANTDIDLGTPGLSAGDQQVFLDRLFQHGHQVGTAAGAAEIVAVSATTLHAQVTVTVDLPDGTLTTQGIFTEVLADGPPPTHQMAITGGTSTYRGASGECTATSINGTDNSAITCTFITA